MIRLIQFENSRGLKLSAKVADNRRKNNFMNESRSGKPAKQSANQPTPYSPNIAPSDFHIFGRIKERLNTVFVKEASHLLDKMKKILRRVLQTLKS
jgi:hypothetical protein